LVEEFVGLIHSVCGVMTVPYRCVKSLL